MRKCYRCKEIKEFTEFHKDKTQSGGISYDCKKCKSEITKLKRKENPEKFREICRKSTYKNIENIRASQKKHKILNRDRICERRRLARELRRDEINLRENQRRKNDPDHLLKERIRQKKWREKNKENLIPKTKAHQLVMFAIKLGVLEKSKECSKCGSTKRIEGHHEDYSKPLDVVWLCNGCHQRHHKCKKMEN